MFSLFYSILFYSGFPELLYGILTKLLIGRAVLETTPKHANVNFNS